MQNPTILIVEDDEDQRWNLVNIMKLLNVAALEAASYDEAQAVVADAPRIDLAILDVDLGRGPTGVDFGEWLVYQSKFARHPPAVIIYSSMERPIYYRQAMQLGAAAFLSKNELDVTELDNHIRSLMILRSLQALDTTERLPEVASNCRNRWEVLGRFATDILKPLLTRHFPGFKHLLWQDFDSYYGLAMEQHAVPERFTSLEQAVNSLSSREPIELYAFDDAYLSLVLAPEASEALEQTVKTYIKPVTMHRILELMNIHKLQQEDRFLNVGNRWITAIVQRLQDIAIEADPYTIGLRLESLIIDLERRRDSLTQKTEVAPVKEVALSQLLKDLPEIGEFLTSAEDRQRAEELGVPDNANFKRAFKATFKHFKAEELKLQAGLDSDTVRIVLKRGGPATPGAVRRLMFDPTYRDTRLQESWSWLINGITELGAQVQRQRKRLGCSLSCSMADSGDLDFKLQFDDQSQEVEYLVDPDLCVTREELDIELMEAQAIFAGLGWRLEDITGDHNHDALALSKVVQTTELA